MLWLTFIIGNTGLLHIHDVNPTLEIHDGLNLGDDHFLSYPLDILVLGSKSYIIGGFPNVYIFKDDVLVSTFGKMGEGPQEFKHWPATIEHYDNQIVITEMYGWSRSFFNKRGLFLKKEHLSKDYLYSGSNTYTFLNLLKDEGILYRLKKGADCFLAKIASDKNIDFHLSEFIFLESHSNKYVIVKLNGVVEYYDEHCEILNNFQLKVGDIIRQPKFDPILTKLENKLHHSQRTYYQYGHPIFDATMDKEKEDGHLWILASNEWKRTKRLKRGEVWLLHLDLKTSHVRRVKLNHIVDRVRVFGDKLVLISTDEAMIRFYAIKDVLAIR